MKLFRIALILGCLPFLAGCMTAVVAAGSMGVAYTVTGVAYKTINAPLDKVEAAANKALNRMDIKIISTVDTEEGREIKAATQNLDIYVELEKITPKTTKISVDARENTVLKDKSTASEIITQTEKGL